MTSTTADVRRTRAVALLRDGAVTLVVLLLAFAAFDDITTGNEADLTVEYGALVACAGWLLLMAFKLIRATRFVLGAISMVALAVAVWGQLAIGPGITPGPWPAYVMTMSAFFWFLIVAVGLLVSGWRVHPERHTPRTQPTADNI